MVLWDADAFFDSLDVPTLVSECEATGFPAVPLTLCMWSHMAARALTVKPATARPVRSGRGILAGCSSSTSCARAYTCRAVQRVQACHRQVRTSQHVDDIPQLATHSTESGVVVNLVSAAADMHEEFTRLKLTTNATKTTVVASTRRLARKVQRLLASRGIDVAVDMAAADVGAVASGGSRRSVSVWRIREAAVRKKAPVAGRFARRGRRARQLWATNVMPSAMYGSSSQGVAPSMVRRLRAYAVESLAPPGLRPCSTSALAWHADGADPAVRVPLKQVTEWVHYWRGLGAKERRHTAAAWRATRERLRATPARRRWAEVAGPLAATVATLLDAGWKPLAPNAWKHGDTLAAMLDRPYPDIVRILAYFRRTLEVALWRRASAHDYSAELAHGRPSFAPARDAHKQAAKLSDTVYSHAIEAVVVGGDAADLRMADGGFVNDKFASHVGICAFCGQAEDLVHRYYRCPCLAAVPDPHGFLSKSEWVVDTREAQRHPLLWTHGLVPACVYDQDDDFESREPPRMNLDRVMAADSAIFATDGAGAPREVPASVTRVGAAAAAIGFKDGVPTEVEIQPLRCPGRQTIPRAEAWAYVVMARSMDDAGLSPTIPVFSDASYVVSAARSSGARASWSTNSDIWQLASARPAAKIKSHLRCTQALAHGHSHEAWLGNLVADMVAGIAAESNQPDKAYQRYVARHEMLAFIALRRAAWIEAHRMRSPPSLVKMPPIFTPPPAPDPYTLAADVLREWRARGHSALLSGGRVRCTA